MPRIRRSTQQRDLERGRNWLCTFNNPPSNDNTEKVLRACPDVRYACGQREIGAGTGTHHDQFYVEFSTTKTLQALRELLPGGHFEVRCGTKQDAHDYAVKEGKFASDKTGVPGTKWEIGEWRGAARGGGRQGAREDLETVQRRLNEGATVADIYQEFPHIAARYPKFVDRCAQIATKPRTWETQVIVFKGPTGCGKTSLAHELYPDIWTKPDGFWFDSYDRHPHVLIDDFAGGRDCGISYRMLLRILDRYPLLVPVKTNFAQFVPRVIVITTNVEPRDWYPWEDFAPLERRITEIRRWDA